MSTNYFKLKFLLRSFLLLGFVQPSFANTKCEPLIQIMTVRGHSMDGLLKENQDLKIDTNYYACHAPKAGDVVVIKKTGFPAPIIKQIFSVPGDRFELKGDENAGAEFLVNGKAIKNFEGKYYRFKAQAFKMLKLYESEFKYILPKEMYFVFGTSGNNSKDSTKFGPVPRSEIIGKLVD